MSPYVPHTLQFVRLIINTPRRLITYMHVMLQTCAGQIPTVITLGELTVARFLLSSAHRFVGISDAQAIRRDRTKNL